MKIGIKRYWSSMGDFDVEKDEFESTKDTFLESVREYWVKVRECDELLNDNEWDNFVNRIGKGWKEGCSMTMNRDGTQLEIDGGESEEKFYVMG